MLNCIRSQSSARSLSLVNLQLTHAKNNDEKENNQFHHELKTLTKPTVIFTPIFDYTLGLKVQKPFQITLLFIFHFYPYLFIFFSIFGPNRLAFIDPSVKEAH